MCTLGVDSRVVRSSKSGGKKCSHLRQNFLRRVTNLQTHSRDVNIQNTAVVKTISYMYICVIHHFILKCPLHLQQSPTLGGQDFSQTTPTVNCLRMVCSYIYLHTPHGMVDVQTRLTTSVTVVAKSSSFKISFARPLNHEANSVYFHNIRTQSK